MEVIICIAHIGLKEKRLNIPRESSVISIVRSLKTAFNLHLSDSEYELYIQLPRGYCCKLIDGANGLIVYYDNHRRFVLLDSAIASSNPSTNPLILRLIRPSHDCILPIIETKSEEKRKEETKDLMSIPSINEGVSYRFCRQILQDGNEYYRGHVFAFLEGVVSLPASQQARRRDLLQRLMQVIIDSDHVLSALPCYTAEIRSSLHRFGAFLSHARDGKLWNTSAAFELDVVQSVDGVDKDIICVGRCIVGSIFVSKADQDLASVGLSLETLVALTHSKYQNIASYCSSVVMKSNEGTDQIIRDLDILGNSLREIVANGRAVDNCGPLPTGRFVSRNEDTVQESFTIVYEHPFLEDSELDFVFIDVSPTAEVDVLSQLKLGAQVETNTFPSIGASGLRDEFVVVGSDSSFEFAVAAKGGGLTKETFFVVENH